jgi:hypothetical protein
MLASWKPFQLERANIDQLEQWNRELQPPIWAGVTGDVSGIFTLDFDGEPGRATLERLGFDPHRGTPRGGFHVDFRLGELAVLSMNCRSKPTLGEHFPGTDSRGRGGYINLLGSSSAGSYEWLKDDRTPYNPELIPDELMELIVERSKVRRGPRSVLLHSSPRATTSTLDVDIAEGLVKRALDLAVDGRNDAGFWLACQLRDAGVSLAEAEGVMLLYQELAPMTDHAGDVNPYTVAEAAASLRSAYGAAPRPGESGLPEILINGRQFSEVSDHALEVLVEANEPPTIFRRGGDKVAVREDERGRFRIESIESDFLRHYMSQKATWVRISEWGRTDAYPPIAVMKDLLARDWDKVPGLEGLTEIPSLRPDGSVLDADGYDAASRLWVSLPADLEMPHVSECPSREEVERAVQILRSAIFEFPFADASSTANALGMVLSVVLRTAVPGPLPLAVIDAPAAGSGKSCLASLASVIASGRPAPMSAAPNGNDEELRKRLTAALMADEPIIVFDNVDRILRSPILAQAITSEIWRDRILGVSRNVSLTQHAAWLATGNNIEIGGDLPRRCYVIRLDPKMAVPAQRTFRRPDLLEWALTNRGELLWACFTLARNWYVLGKPSPDGASWAGFEGFRRFIGGILQAAGIRGFLDNLAELQQGADPELLAWARLAQYWSRIHGNKSVAARDLSVSLCMYAQKQELPRGLAETLDRAGESSRVPRLSRELGRMDGRYLTDGGLRIEKAGRDKTLKVDLWRVVPESSEMVEVPESSAA